MEFVIGFSGMLVCLFLLVGGIVVGWKLKVADERRTQRVTAAALTDEQKRALREEQEAWRELHNYNVETAYDLPRNDKKE